MPIVAALPELQREEAFRRFHDAQRHRLLQGTRASYNTKQIKFLGVPAAHIADQWSSKSMHVLDDENWLQGEFNPKWDAFPRLCGKLGQTLGNSFDATGYERYCRALDELACYIGASDGAEAERRLYSAKGHPWRERVRALWKRGDRR